MKKQFDKKKYQRQYQKQRVNRSPALKARNTYDRALYKALRGEQFLHNNFALAGMIGCGIERFREHLEELWESGMSWANFGRGGWVLKFKHDLYDVSDFEEARLCYHYKNIGVQWWHESVKRKTIVKRKYDI